jgi:hypothetical protein
VPHSLAELCVLPAEDLIKGRTVLDIGGFDGFFSQLFLERGAKYAIVLDNQEFLRYGWPDPCEALIADLPKDRGRKVLSLPGRGPQWFVKGDLMEWGDGADIVLFMNVLYHVNDPFAAMERVASLTREWLFISTSIIPDNEAGPDGWKWYLHGEGHSDPEVGKTVPCRPTFGAFREIIEKNGFVIEAEHLAGDHVGYRCRKVAK